MRDLVKSYPAEVVGINGTNTGPWQPGPSSSFTYTLDVTMDDKVRTFAGVKPNTERWSDQLDATPIRIGTLVNVFIVGTRIVMDARELPYWRPCPSPGGFV